MSEKPESAPVTDARSAIESGRWQLALDLLDDAASVLDEAERLELRAAAAYGNGEFEAAVTAWEELDALQARRGNDGEAARAAAMVAMYLMMDTGLMAPVRGWLRRAERHLEGIDECPAHAIVAMTRTYERFMCGDMAAAGVEAGRAIELGQRLGVTPAVVIGRVATARILILDGEVEEGLGLLDEVATLLMSPNVDPLTAGMMYCELICAAQGLAMHDRAAEWTAVMEQWRHGAAFGGINGRCRVHRAEMLRFTGPCDRAEEEALAACEELRPWMRREFGWPLVELGMIRLRKGDLEGAEAALLAAHEHAWCPHPGLALLRLEQGDIAAAVDLIDEAVAHPLEIPSKERPPFGDLRVAPLLDAQAEIAAAAGDATTSRRAADRLQEIATRYSSRSLEAAAHLADARASLVGGDLEHAANAASNAVMAWTDVGAPFETAVARMVLADVHMRSGRAESAELERTAARVAFQSFGAVRWATLAATTSDSVETARSGQRATATFRADGGTRTVCFDDCTVTLRDLKGLRHIERLLREPGREVHVLDLVAADVGHSPSAPSAGADDPGVDFVSDGVGAGLPMLDDTARHAYRRRLAEVDEDIEDARRNNDLGRLELAERDRDYLIAELQRATGLGGRSRTTGSTAERARTSVTRSIRYALARLAEHHPVLADHLGQHVQTGTFCCYVSDPMITVDWQL